MQSQQIKYSEKYYDLNYEYRHVILPPNLNKLIPSNRLLTEAEWRSYGIQQSKGWVHYSIHPPEPHILLFRREIKNNFELEK
jgi:cyclin-dependent kinase regulatory subunit CKS1